MISRVSERSCRSSLLTERGRTRASAISTSAPPTSQSGRTARRRVWPPTITLSSTLKLAKTRPCWKVRATPHAAISSGRSPAIRRPSKTIDPASDRSRPLMRLKVVVLPAPLGPMMLTSSPSVTSRSKASTAVIPPNRRVRPRISSEGVIRFTPPPDALRPEPDQQQQRQAIDEDPVFGRDPEQFGQANKRDGAEDCAHDIAHAAEDDHCQREQRELCVESLMVDVGIEVRRYGAADPGAKSSESESERLVAIDADPIGPRGDFIFAHRPQRAAEMRIQKTRLQ